MADKLFELDPTSFTTGARNWLQQKRDQALGAAGNGRAFGRHTTRLVTNKLYRAWKRYLGMQGKQGTNVELAHFVTQFFGSDRLTSLSQQFPQLLPAADPVQQQQQQQQQPAQTQPRAAPAPQAPVVPPPAAPAQPAATPQAMPDDTASMQRFQSYLHRLTPQLQTATPNGAAVMRTLGAMLRDFSKRSDKAKGWVRSYIANNLSGYANVIPELKDLTSTDPFSFVQARPARTPTQAAPTAAPTAAPRAESRRVTGRLVEADPSLEIPQPGGTPPDFMQRQRSTAPSSAPPQPFALNRKTTDAILVALARTLIDSGDAGRRTNGNAPSAQPAPARANPATMKSGSAGHARHHDMMHIKLTPMALENATRSSGVRISHRDYNIIEQTIRKNGGTATIGQIIAALGQNVPQATVQTLMYASQYGVH